MVWRSSSVAFVVSEPNLRLSAALPVTEFFCTPELRDAFIFFVSSTRVPAVHEARARDWTAFGGDALSSVPPRRCSYIEGRYWVRSWVVSGHR